MVNANAAWGLPRPRREYLTVVGTVARTGWLDTTSLDEDSPRVRITVVEGRKLAHIEWRVFKKGVKYRTEWLDGSPIRLFDGRRRLTFR